MRFCRPHVRAARRILGSVFLNICKKEDSMGVLEICLIVICSLAVVAVVGSAVYRRIKGKPGGCGCGCEGCPHACNRRKDG